MAVTVPYRGGQLRSESLGERVKIIPVERTNSLNLIMAVSSSSERLT